MKYKLSIVLLFTIAVVTVFGSQIKVINGDAVLPFDEKRILFISSYSPSFPTFYNQINGIYDSFDEYPIIIDVEFMDSKRFYTTENFDAFLENITYKMSFIDYDLIMTSDDNAIEFVIENRSTTFKDIPIVFFGVNNQANAKVYSNENGITGVVENSSMKETIDMSLSLNTEATKVVALVDNTNTAQSELGQFYELSNLYQEIEFSDINLGEMSLEQFSNQISEIGNNSVVLLIAALRDIDETSYEFKQTLGVILSHAKVPIYHLYEFGIKEGLLGGKVISHYAQAQTASGIVIQVFAGQDIDSIDLVETSPNINLINYEVLQEYNLNRGALPEDTIFINRNITIFEQYGIYIVIGILFFIAESAIIILLILNTRSRRKAQIELMSSNEQLEELNETLIYKSYHDELTGLYNRNYFEEQYPRLKDIDPNIPISIVLIDVNGLKLINDAFGHITGDKVLIETSKILLSLFVDSDIFRIGGDEFAIIPYGKKEKTLSRLVSKLNKEMQKVKFEGIVLSVSVGFAYLDDTKTLDEMYTEAEDWMYREKLNSVPSNRSATIDAIIATINQKDKYSEEHSKRVSEIAVKIAEYVEVSDNIRSEIKTAGLLHDIGKIIVPTTILNKVGKLTPEEFDEIKKHSEIGYRILNSVATMRNIANYVLCHHERIDGKGYPRGIKGNDIPIQSRIIAIADAMDAMLTDRLYRSRLTKEEVYKELKEHQGTQFCYNTIDKVLHHFDEIYDFVIDIDLKTK